MPVHPYVLGVWLGDGTLSGARVTSSHDDADEMEANLANCGITVNRTRHSNAVSLRLGDGIRGNRSSSDFTNSLREAGVYGCKYIPEIYFRGSPMNRLKLLLKNMSPCSILVLTIGISEMNHILAITGRLTGGFVRRRGNILLCLTMMMSGQSGRRPHRARLSATNAGAAAWNCYPAKDAMQLSIVRLNAERDIGLRTKGGAMRYDG